ncbi:MAG: energy transducer TonB [Desulfatiglans sp.]|jgi:protein TonB|nr:energy transducer TonB [Desulfatiglans sp.]
MNRYNKYLLVHLAAGIKSLRVWSGLLAIFMTLLMFTIMPALLKPAENHPVRERYVIQNKEIFILEPDTPEEFKEPEPLKPLSKKPHILVSPASEKGPKPKTYMVFEINPNLTGSSDFKLPAPGTISALELGLPNIFNAGDLDHPLISVKRIPPVYPVRAKKEKIQGYVTIQFIVNTKGAVEDVTVLESNPSGVFDQSVITCVHKWLFKPGAVNGEVVNTLAQTTVNFELEQN